MTLSVKNYFKPLALAGVVVLSTGCALNASKTVVDTGPSDFELCSIAVTSVSAKANNPATHNLAAKQALSCLEDARHSAETLNDAQLMQVHALAIADFLKAGEISRAKEELTQFKDDYPRRDLYLENGASLIDTFDLVLGNASPDQASKDSLLNAHPVLKGEIRRQQHWEVN